MEDRLIFGLKRITINEIKNNYTTFNISQHIRFLRFF